MGQWCLSLLRRIINRGRIHILLWRQRRLDREIQRLRRQDDHLAAWELARSRAAIRALEAEARAVDATILRLRNELRRNEA